MRTSHSTLTPTVVRSLARDALDQALPWRRVGRRVSVTAEVRLVPRPHLDGNAKPLPPPSRFAKMLRRPAVQNRRPFFVSSTCIMTQGALRGVRERTYSNEDAVKACSCGLTLTAMSAQCAIDAADQGILVEGFGQKAACPARERTRARTGIGHGGDEDQRHRVALRAQMRLHVEAAHRGHSDIHDGARGLGKLRRLQKRFRRIKDMDDVSE